jgi:hypothetical protein
MKINMEYAPPKYSDKELLKMFPQAKEIIPKKIEECKEATDEKVASIATALESVYAFKADELSEWFGEEIIKIFMMPSLAKLEKTMFRLNNLKYLLNPNEQKNSRIEFQEKIETARRYPIEELARSKLELRQVGKNYIAL